MKTHNIIPALAATLALLSLNVSAAEKEVKPTGANIETPAPASNTEVCLSCDSDGWKNMGDRAVFEAFKRGDDFVGLQFMEYYVSKPKQALVGTKVTLRSGF